MFYLGKEVVPESKSRSLILKFYHRNKEIGRRALYHLLRRRYAGITEKAIIQVLSTDEEYQRTTARFVNKAPLKHVNSNGVHDVLQVDLVDMRRDAVVHHKKKLRFILSIMDIFSRYVWLYALPNKASRSVICCKKTQGIV